MVGAGGLVTSIVAFAVGAILDWAVTEPYQHGFDLKEVGWILMVVGAVGAAISIVIMVASSVRRHRTTVQDANGTVVRRVDSDF